MRPEELRVGDFVLMPWYGQKVVGSVVLVSTDRVHVFPFEPGNHMPRETIFKQDNDLEPVPLTCQTLGGWGFRFTNEDSTSIILHMEGPVPIWLEWKEDNKAFFLGDSLIPVPVCNVHQVQHLFKDFGIPIDTKDIIL